MALSNHERVGKALDLRVAGLKPFVERELQAAYGKDWLAKGGLLDAHPAPGKKQNARNLDSHALLSAMWDQWNDVFKKTLGQAERSLVSELRDVRNKWAHQESFSTDDAYRALDSISRLLTAVSAEEAAELEKQKQEVLRVRFEEQARRAKRRAATASVEGRPAGGLKPWREIVTPHPDVASGRYQQAEFAADLGQVHRGEGADEYNPPEFFRRTFLTDGLKHLLANALLRLTAKGGDPVVELQTNFGGGKTHSMLALYHLFSGVAPADLPGIDPVLEEEIGSADVFVDKLHKRFLLAVSQRCSITIEEITLHLTSLGIELQERSVATAVDAEREVDFRLGMIREIIERPFLARQLPEQGGKDRANQCGLSGAVLADDGDQPGPKGVKVHPYLVRKSLCQSSEPNSFKAHDDAFSSKW